MPEPADDGDFRFLSGVGHWGILEAAFEVILRVPARLKTANRGE